MELGLIVETERLILRKYRQGDLQDLIEYFLDLEVQKYEPCLPVDLAGSKANLEWRISADGIIAVEQKGSRKVIGNVYLGKDEVGTVELGFAFRQDFCGHGYARESCFALINLAFLKGIHRIAAYCDTENQKSQRLLESLGFEREAHLKKICLTGAVEIKSPFGKTPLSMQN